MEGSASVEVGSLGISVEVPLNNVRPYFKRGDIVKVMVGHYVGCRGWVIEVGADGLSIWMEKSECSVSAWCCTGC